MERQVLGRDRFVAQNNPVVCKEASASFIKELLILHIAVGCTCRTVCASHTSAPPSPFIEYGWPGGWTGLPP